MASLRLKTSPQARVFVEKYVLVMIEKILSRTSEPQACEQNWIRDMLGYAVEIVVQCIRSQDEIQLVSNTFVLKVLGCVFNREQAYYVCLQNEKSGDATSATGLGELRVSMVHSFFTKSGFSLLAQWIEKKQKYIKLRDAIIPLHTIFSASVDTLRSLPKPVHQPTDGDDVEMTQDYAHDPIQLGRAVMEWIDHFLADDNVVRLPFGNIATVLSGLGLLFDELANTHVGEMLEYYAFWRRLCLRLILHSSLRLKLYGWDLVNDLIRAVEKHPTPPRAVLVEGAGCTFCNGVYTYDAERTTEDGSVMLGQEAAYVRTVPDGELKGKQLTLFRCVLRSGRKWWFLSNADEEQPGTDRDIDFYCQKEPQGTSSHCPLAGWSVCPTHGAGPSPSMKPRGRMVTTLQHALSKWAIENEVLETVFNGEENNRAVVSKSTLLIKYLATTRKFQSDKVAHALKGSHMELISRFCKKERRGQDDTMVECIPTARNLPYGTLRGNLLQFGSNQMAFESPPILGQDDSCHASLKCILLSTDGMLPLSSTGGLVRACQATGWSIVQPIATKREAEGYGDLNFFDEMCTLSRYLLLHHKATRICFIGAFKGTGSFASAQTMAQRLAAAQNSEQTNVASYFDLPEANCDTEAMTDETELNFEEIKRLLIQAKGDIPVEMQVEFARNQAMITSSNHLLSTRVTNSLTCGW